MKRVCCLCLLLALLLLGCRNGAKTVALSEAATARASATPRHVPVEVFEVNAPTEERAQSIPAVIAAEGTAIVLAGRDGVIVALSGQEGAHVKQGEVLARLADDETRAHLRQAELEVTRLQFEERQYEAMIKVNRSELARQQTLARDGLVSQTEIERAQYKLEVSEQELEKTRLATRMAQARAETAKLEVDKTLIRAPLTGLITQQSARLGSSITRNEKLFEVAPSGPLEVRFQLAQSDSWQPRRGELIQLARTGDEHIIASARIERLAPIADHASNARAYWATVRGGATLIPGTAVFVQRPQTQHNTGWWIPRAAFAADAELQRGSSAVLLMVENGKCAARTIWLSAVVGDQVEVRSGIERGDQIILLPAAELKAGDEVTVSKP